MSEVGEGLDGLVLAEESGQERCVLWHHADARANPERAEAWLRTAFTRMEVQGGEPLAQTSGDLVFGFDALDVEDVVELALGLSGEAAESQAGARIVSAIGLGPLRRSDAAGPLPWWFGRVLDRTRALSQQLTPNQVALDGAAQERVAERYLFLGSVGTGDGSGHLLDVAHPHAQACRSALSLLQPVRLGPLQMRGFDSLCALLDSTEARRVSLRASDTDEANGWLLRAYDERGTQPSLHLGRQAGGLQPLGALQLALRRRRTRGVDWQDLEPAQRELLDAVVAGGAVERSATSAALIALLQRDARAGRAPWVVLDRLHDVDPASLHMVATLLQAADLRLVLCMTLPLDAKVPSALLRGGETSELRIEPPTLRERCELAEQLLDVSAGAGVARRVALLSSPSVRGVVEAARTLVSSGDLVRDATRFVWRAGPRGGGLPVPVDALLSERLKGLGPEAHRVLDATCIAAPDIGAALVDRIVALDGLDAESIAAGRAQLVYEGWLDPHGNLGSGTSGVVSSVRSNMPPARAAELHRFAARVMSENMADGFSRGLVAHHHAEGGQPSEAARALLKTAQLAGECGFDKSAVRLAGRAVQLDASAENREFAGQLARTYEAATPGGTVQDTAAASDPARSTAEPVHVAERGNVGPRAMRMAVRAVLDDDFETAEGLLDTALAAGWSAAAVARMRSVTRLSQGDVSAAIRVLQDARGASADSASKPRLQLVEALILMRCGHVEDAVCAALDGLAACRRSTDRVGEQAALHVLCAAYKQLSRDAEAEQIDARARAVA